jgi:hypothetical protein
MGRPGRVKRSLTIDECSNIHAISDHYVQYREDYLLEQEG